MKASQSTQWFIGFELFPADRTFLLVISLIRHRPKLLGWQSADLFLG